MTTYSYEKRELLPNHANMHALEHKIKVLTY